MATLPTKQKTAPPRQSRKISPAKDSNLPVKKTGLKSTISGTMFALKAYFAKANGYEATAMILFACVLMVIVFARPAHDIRPTVLRILALVTAMAAKFMANVGLSQNPGSTTDQADAKRLSLVMDGVAVGLTAVSFFVAHP